MTSKYKVCYIATLSSTLKTFVLKSALYNIKHGNWDVTFICDTDETFASQLPESIHYIPITIKRGINISGILSTAKLYQIFKKERFHLVQYCTANAGCYAGLASFFARVPIRLYCQWGLGCFHMKGIARLAKTFLEKTICNCSTHIQPDSKENLQLAITKGLYDEKKGCVIGNGSASGVDLNQFNIANKAEWRSRTRKRHNIPDEEFVFGYVGRMLRDKGINALLHAFKHICESRPNVTLMMIGDDVNVEGIDEGLWKWGRNSNKVIFTGRTNEVPVYMSAMDCFVLPSYHEGFGSVTIEAESMGVPVIDTDIPGSREAMKVGHTGIAIPVRNSSALYDAMNTMIEDNCMRQQYSENAYKYVLDNFEQNALFEKIFENRSMLLNSLKL